MLSYRHAFHAGNHADVLKHLVLIHLLHYLGQKTTPYLYVDTHAGAGMYALDSGYATKNAEYESGIARIWNRKDLPPALAQYIQLIQSFNPSGALRYYPGSPYCAEQILRDQDRMRLFELHPTDKRLLHTNFHQTGLHSEHVLERGKRVIIQEKDGLEGLKAWLPPPSRRALVLIDPSYEDKRDYRRVCETLSDALARFATGMYAVWYPILQRAEANRFPEKLKRLAPKNWLNVTLTVGKPLPDGFGLRSSGMFVFNPAWTLEAALRETMPYLTKALAQDNGAEFTLECAEAE